MNEGETPKNAFNPIRISDGTYIGIHWNDGPVICKPEQPEACHGFLEVPTCIPSDAHMSTTL